MTTNKPSAEGRIELRPEVAAFAQLMERELRANDHKGGWANEDPRHLYDRLIEEDSELKVALHQYQGRVRRGEGGPTADASEIVGSEAADVANFAMMIADVCGALATSPPHPEGEGENPGWRDRFKALIAAYRSDRLALSDGVDHIYRQELTPTTTFINDLESALGAWVLTAEQSQQFATALVSAPEPSAALKAAARAHPEGEDLLGNALALIKSVKARLEELTCGNRAYDATIAEALGAQVTRTHGRFRIAYRHAPWIKGVGSCWRSIPRYTASIDAAVGLVEQVLPGQGWKVLYGALMDWRAHLPGDLQIYLPRFILLDLVSALQAQEGGL